MKDPNTRNLDHLSDAKELENPYITHRKDTDIKVGRSPGVPEEAVKGHRTVQKIPKPSGVKFD